MKTMSYLVVTIAMLASAAAFAQCPPVTLTNDCLTAGAAALFNGEADTYIGILVALEIIPADVVTWPTADFDEDGLPDQQAMYLLAAVLCAEDATIGGEFAANQAAYLGTVSSIGDALTANEGLPQQMRDTAALCTAAVAALNGIGPPAGPLTDLRDGLLALGGGLAPGGADDLESSMGDFGLYASMLGGIGDWVAGMGGLSTPTKAYMEGFLTALVGSEINPAGQDLIDTATLVGGGAATIPVRAVLIGLGVPALVADAVEAARVALIAVAGATDTFGDSLVAVTAPTFDVYSCIGKTTNEPFAAAGDYDNDGVTNLTTYGITGGGAAFVAAASGANPFYAGNPNVPVAGLLGLSLLASACAAAGAFVIRRK